MPLPECRRLEQSMELHQAGPPSTDVPPRFTTPDLGLAQYLAFRSWRCLCTIDPIDERTLLYSFVESADLRTDIEQYYDGASVPAIGFTAAGQTIRRLANGARHSFAEWKRRTMAREDSSHMHYTRQQARLGSSPRIAARDGGDHGRQ
jgi:hypothetical protein